MSSLVLGLTGLAGVWAGWITVSLTGDAPADFVCSRVSTTVLNWAATALASRAA